mmetsp:Transcript_88517/g.140880  ORF Transcript_88517/g.140880 Transcript_88517/m.140880 type:complete len:130 (+) Transcript_88517:3-392(+)
MTAVAMFFALRGRREVAQVALPEPLMPHVDIEAQILPRLDQLQAGLTGELQEVEGTLHAVQRRLSVEVDARTALEKFAMDSCEQLGPRIANLRSDLDLVLMHVFAPPPPPPGLFREGEDGLLPEGDEVV